MNNDANKWKEFLRWWEQRLRGQKTMDCDGFNTATDLTYSELVGKLEGVKRVILKFGQLTSIYLDKKDLLAGQNTFISASQYEDLANAIQELILGKKEE